MLLYFILGALFIVLFKFIEENMAALAELCISKINLVIANNNLAMKKLVEEAEKSKKKTMKKNRKQDSKTQSMRLINLSFILFLYRFIY